MDTSEEYIEMCRKAVEVQEWWHNNPHIISEWARSYFISPKDGSLIHYHDFGAYPQHSTGYIWLPRQDQLQDMIWESLSTHCSNKLNSFMWGVWDFCNTIDDLDSMERLWFAFVMWEKYRKKWNGRNWIKS